MLLPRVGPRALIVTGMLLGGGAMAYLTQLTVTSSYAADVAAGAAGHGPGLRHDLRAGHQHRHRRRGPRQDSGVASALVNTMQQVGGSIGTAALSTMALTATASYLTAHHAGGWRRPPPRCTATPWRSPCPPSLFGLGALAAVLLLPSRRRLQELRDAAPADDAAAALSPARAQAMTASGRAADPSISHDLP